MEFDRLTVAEKAALGGGALAVVGAILPWVTAGQVTVTGLNGDGILTLLCGGGAAAIVFAREWERLDRIAVAGLGGLTTLIAVQVLTGLAATLGPVTPSVTPSAGIGLYLTILAGLVMLGAGVNGYMNLEEPSAKPVHGDR